MGGGGGGGRPFPITFVVHNQKSNWGGAMGAHGVNGGAIYIFSVFCPNHMPEVYINVKFVINCMKQKEKSQQEKNTPKQTNKQNRTENKTKQNKQTNMYLT